MYGSYARWTRSDDYPWAMTKSEHEAAMVPFEQRWGTAIGLKTFAPSIATEESARASWGRYLRAAASPGAALSLYRMNIEIDIRNVLPTVRVPTLVLHRTGDRLVDVGNGRYLAAHIGGARYIELPGEDHLYFVGDTDRLVAEIQEFLTGVRPVLDDDTVLATVLFVDIVESTRLAVEVGDARWRTLLSQYLQRVHRQVEHFRGRVVDTAGDGVFATFDGPARAVRCARAIHEEATALGLSLRTGLHTGECQLKDDKFSGISVHIGARVAAHAAPGETLATGTVKSLVAGSGLRFEDRGTHVLKGVPWEWPLFAVS
jgi:class 3 adenylate cyclase